MLLRVETKIRNSNGSETQTCTHLRVVQAFSTHSLMAHLIVLIHGVNGYASDLDYIKERIQKISPSLVVIAPTCNQGQTHSGIEDGAKRYYHWIKNYCINNNVDEISIIGHSLGGLYARCLVGLLFQGNWIPENLKPRYFISLSTPHLPLRYYDRFVPSAVSSAIANCLIGKSGQEMLMLDTQTQGRSFADRFKCHPKESQSELPEVPILVRLCDKPYLDGLAAFQKLICYANIRHDPVVNYANAALTRFDYCNKRADKLFKSVELPHIFIDDRDEEIDETSTEMEDRLLQQLACLPWERYGIIPSRAILAHADMVNKFKKWSEKHGDKVIDHIASHFLQDFKSASTSSLQSIQTITNL
jgi:hypothetical protein